MTDGLASQLGPRRLPASLRRGAGSLRGAPRRIKWALEDRRLVAEQTKRVLGPAHRRWRGNSPGDIRQKWNPWDWSSRGEQWNMSDACKRALIDEVLCVWMREGGLLLEIGPGGGRWSEALAARASRLTLVDVSERALEIWRERFRDATNIDYVLSAGASLPGVRSGSIDGVWSFDVFVHIAPCDQADYLMEIARVLAPGGIAVIHHSDGRNRGLLPSRHGWRAPMSCGLFAALAAERGLRVERHIDSWGPDGCYDLSGYHDAITVCTRS